MTTGVTELMVKGAADGAVLYSATGPDGGCAAWRIDGVGGARPFGQSLFSGAARLPAETGLLALDLGGGEVGLAALGRQGASLQAELFDTAGRLSGRTVTLTPADGLGGAPMLGAQLGAGAGSVVALTETGNGLIHSFTLGGDGRLTARATADPIADSGLSRGGMVTALAGTDTAAGHVLLVGVSGTDEVLSYRADTNGGLRLAGQVGLTTGLGIADPSAITTVTVKGVQYALIASAGSSSLTVAAIARDGTLHPTDQVIDSLATRFQGVTHIATATIDGQVYLMAGGGG